MFERPWSGPYALLAFALILWVVSSLLVWQVASQRQFYAETATYHAEGAASEASAELQDCLARPSRIEMIKCAEIVIEEKRAAQRAEDNLAAQQEMAYWTPWMLLSSVIAATAAAVGVVYVAGTLREMQRTNEIAHRHFLASQRPWISIDAQVGSDLVLNDKEGRVTIIFKLKNYGVSPANNVQIKAELIPGAFEGWRRLEDIHDSARRFPNTKELGHNLFPGAEHVLSINMPLSIEKIKAVKSKYGLTDMKEIRVEFVSCAVYISPVDNQKYFTDLVMHFCQRDPNDVSKTSLIQLTGGRTRQSELHLVREFGSGQAY